MTDELLPYYNRELAFLRDMGAEFAKANPKIAGRLRLDADATEDPHVARMIEAVAYLNARTRHKLDDDFPEISEAILNVLYPHYLAPIPSMAIVQLTLDKSQGELTDGYAVPAASAIETETIDGQPCRFQTAYPVQAWPFRVSGGRFISPPFPVPDTSYRQKVRAAVQISLETYSDKVPFGAIPIESIRFYLAGQTLHTYDLYELIFNNTLGIAIRSPSLSEPVLLGKECIRPVGFDRDEGLLPYTAQSFLGYRMLSEYFVFPQKFLFFDVSGIVADRLAAAGNQIEIHLYLNRHLAELERAVNKETFQLGCTPVVNLFRQRAEKIDVSHSAFEYRVVPDARRPRAHEVYSIDRVVATTADNEQLDFQPFYSARHAGRAGHTRSYWNARRVFAGYSGGEIDNGTEVYLSFVDLDFRPAAPANWLVDVETTCLNRDLPHQLPFGGGQPQLQLTVGGPLAGVRCLTRPTATLRPSLRQGTVWRLISHLTLNHLSLADNTNGAEALREILKLYDFSDSAETRDMIDGLLSVQSRRVAGRVKGAMSGGFCRGTEVTLELDEEKFVGSGVYLFAMVLERFLGLYSSINSFTKTVVTTKQREGILCRCPPRAGEQILL